MFAVAVACQDDDEPANSITTEEAAVIISSSLASNTSGVTMVSGKTTNVTEDLLEDNAGGRVAACGLSQNLDLSGASPAGATITYSYDFSYKFKLNCSAESPSDVSANLSYSGAFESAKLAAEHSGTSELTVTGLETAVAGNSTVEITLKDVVIDKATHKIVSGTGSYLINGTVPDKGNFNYSGEINFEGLDIAVLTIKGDKFSCNLKNSEVTKK